MVVCVWIEFSDVIRVDFYCLGVFVGVEIDIV